MKSTFKTNSVNTGAFAAGFKKWFTMAAIAIGFSCLYHTARAQDAPANTNANYPGGIDQFYSYILTNMKLDRTCIPGKKIYVQFLIDKEGNLKRAKVRGTGLSADMNAQLVKLFESAPKWQPAQQNGMVVKEHFVCPVIFMPKQDLMAKADLPVMKQ